MTTRTIQQLFDLKGKTALVTGGSRGLGLQMAHALGEAGAKIMLSSRKAEDLEQAAAELQAAGIDARWIAADCAKEADIARLEAKLTESSINLGKNHPQTLRSQSELATLKAQLEAETRKISSSIETTYQVSKQREQQLQTNLESQTNQTNIAVLNPATPPTEPSKPKLVLNILVSMFVGMLLGVGLALALELSKRRVRSSSDLAEALGLPVLGAVSSVTGMLKLRQAAAST